jgi:hypothetical protein
MDEISEYHHAGKTIILTCIESGGYFVTIDGRKLPLIYTSELEALQAACLMVTRDGEIKEPQQ